MDHQAVGTQLFDGGVTEQHQRRAAELDDDFGGARGHALAGAQIKRDVRPAPIVDHHLHGDKGFGSRVGRHIGLLAIPGHRFTTDHAFAVLAAGHLAQHILRRGDLHRAQYLGLFVAHGIRLEGHGRFHGDQGQQLEEMIRHHVAQRPGRLIIGAPTFHPDGFGGGDLDVIDVTAVPDGYEDAVGETHAQ